MKGVCTVGCGECGGFIYVGWGTLGHAVRRLLVGIGDRALDQDWFRIVCFVSCLACFVHGISLVQLSRSEWYVAAFL